MTISVAITRIELLPKSTGHVVTSVAVLTPTDEADVTVSVKQNGQPAIEMVFRVEVRSSLDQVAEEVRTKVLLFAKDLHKAAQNPLVGTQSGP